VTIYGHRNEFNMHRLLNHFSLHTNDRVRRSYRKLVLDSHGSHWAGFNRTPTENEIIPVLNERVSACLCILLISCTLLILFVFAVMKQRCRQLVEQRRGLNKTILTINFLTAIPDAYATAYKPETIRNSAAVTGTVSVQIESKYSLLSN